MRFEGLTPAERRELLERFRDYHRQQYGEGTEPSTRQVRQLMKRREGLLVDYADRLPRVALSRCPHCAAPLRHSFDPHGLDGFWWGVTCEVDFEEPPACEHFSVLQGALDLHGRTPSEVVWELSREVLPGPQVPFVIPRLLALDDMKAVVSSFRLPAGDTVYPIAYFAAERPPSKLLHQPWARRDYQVADAEGRPVGWDSKLDPWDFDLARWLEAGKLLWIAPEDDTLTLHSSAPCPYVGLPGDRAPQRLADGARELHPLPEGGTIDPLD